MPSELRKWANPTEEEKKADLARYERLQRSLEEDKADQWEEEAARLGVEIIQLKSEVAYLTRDRDNERKHSYERLDQWREALAQSDKYREESERWKKAYEELQSNLNEMIKRLERLSR